MIEMIIPAWQKILLNCDGKSLSRTQKLAHLAYSHVVKIVKMLEKKKIIRTVKIGRTRIINLNDIIKPFIIELRKITKK